ncbi:hypothetical protein [Lentzea sp. NPDC003310]|uniref:hypothetical protein n=1 Tax=Lentzea sp. NPDC003310 TaxID=3154447 RepID=UPI0033ABCCD5
MVAATFLATLGGYATYTFIAPILIDESGFAEQHLRLLLLLFGAGSLAGSRLADHDLRIGLVVLAATTLLFRLSLSNELLTGVLLFALGAAFFLIVPAERPHRGRHCRPGPNARHQRQRGRLQPQHHGGEQRGAPAREGRHRATRAGAPVSRNPGGGDRADRPDARV